MPKKISQATRDQLLLALACGMTLESAARQAGLNEKTARRRMKDPEFLAEIRKIQNEMLHRTAAHLTAAGTEAVRTLVQLLQPTNSGTVRLGAARAVLEVGMKIRETAEFEMRLAALEATEAERKAHEAR